MAETIRESGTAAAVLDFARSRRGAADRAEADLLHAAIEWAAMHPVESLAAAATVWDSSYGDTAITVAGPGAPLVAEFSVAEFAAALGVSTDAGRAYLGEAVELRYRLPQVLARVVPGGLVAWRARRIARATILLSPQAAAFVDAHVAHVAHKIGVGQLDKLIEEAIARFMPDEAERRRRAAADGRCFHVDKQQPTLQGTSQVWRTLDLADALDLDAAVTTEAAHLKALGSTESLDVRRAIALGQIARRHDTLDLQPDDDQPGQRGHHRGRATRKPRRVVLHVHLSSAAIRPGGAGIGRIENTRSPITAEQIRQWCANPDAMVDVRPVVDLEDHVHVNAYEVPDRMREAAALVDHTCVFPWCTRPARAGHPGEHDADCDHIQSHDRGGTTCSCNLAPLCRRHHRLKTHGAWRYTQIERGTYLWRSPHGYQYLRDHQGTLDVTRDRHHPPDAHPPDD